MPAVLHHDELHVIIYPNDHRPARVHVKAAAGEAVFVLNCPDGPPSLRESFGFSPSSLGKMKADLMPWLAA